MVLFILASVLVVVIGVLLYLRFSHGGRLIRKIPGPPPLPIVGNAWDIMLSSDKLFKYLRNVHKLYGGIVRLYGFHRRALLICNIEDVETILSSSRFNTKKQPYNFISPWLGEGLLTSNGAKWSHRRKLLTPAFHFNILKKFARVFVEQTDKFLHDVQNEVGKGKTDLRPLISKATLRVMCESSMGIPMNKEISDTYFKELHTLGQCILYRLCRMWAFTDWVYNLTPVARKQRQALKILHDFTNNVIQERKIRKKNEVKNEDMTGLNYGKRPCLGLLDLLLENEKNGQIDEVGIREEVDTFLFEGHDTTAVALTLMIMRIANDSEVQDKIYEEMQQIFGDSQRSPTIEDLNEMKYLECCIKESLRLYPSVPIIVREITEDVVLSGYTVPSGTMCYIQIYDLHRREDLYPDPEKFIPERFLPENQRQRHPYSYIPFSAGPRNCIGQKFAMLEMKTVMSSLLRNFRLEPITRPEDLVFMSDLVLRTNHTIDVKFHPRNKNGVTKVIKCSGSNGLK